MKSNCLYCLFSYYHVLDNKELTLSTLFVTVIIGCNIKRTLMMEIPSMITI